MYQNKQKYASQKKKKNSSVYEWITKIKTWSTYIKNVSINK